MLSLTVSHFMPVEARRRHHEVGSSVFLQVGVMFAVLLAFVFNEVWSEYNVASQAINAESAALHEVALLADALPGGVGAPIRNGVVEYAERVVRVEWPAMERRDHDLGASLDFASLERRVAALDLTRPGAAAAQSQMLGLLASAHEARETRFFQMTQALPGPIWAILGLYSAILVGFVVLAGVETLGGHLFFTGAFAGCTVLVLLLIQMLDYPFEGVLALQPDDFVALIRRIHDTG